MSTEKKMVLFRLPPEKHKQLMIYCVSHDTSIQKLLESFVDLLLEREIPPEKAFEAIKKTDP